MALDPTQAEAATKALQEQILAAIGQGGGGLTYEELLTAGLATEAKQDSLIALLPATLGQTTKSGSLSVTMASDQSFNSARGGTPVTITRPANTTAYTAGDVIGDTGGSAIISFGGMANTSAASIMIMSVELEIALTALPPGMDTFTLKFYNAAPTAIADNAAWSFPSGDSGKFVGEVKLVAPVAMGESTNKRLFSCNDDINKLLKLSATTLYVQLQTDAAYTPTSGEVYKLTINAVEV